MANGDIQRMLGVQDVAQSDTLIDDVQLVKGASPQGLPATSMSQSMGIGNMPQRDQIREGGNVAMPPRSQMKEADYATWLSQNMNRVQEERRSSKKTKVGQILDKPIIGKDGNKTDLTIEIVEAFIDRGPSVDTESAIEKILPKDNIVTKMVDETRNERMAAKGGGLIQLAAGGNFRGRVSGDGHGMEDNVYMPIRNQGQQLGTLAVSPKEYVVDAHTMSALGNGNADEGADVMDKVVRNVREQAYGTERQPNEINGLTALRPMIERV